MLRVEILNCSYIDHWAEKKVLQSKHIKGGSWECVRLGVTTFCVRRGLFGHERRTKASSWIKIHNDIMTKEIGFSEIVM